MAEVTESQGGSGLDTPVSNRAISVATSEPVSPPPHLGDQPGTPSDLNTNGSEQVEGFQRIERATPELADALGSTRLPDIGEASFGRRGNGGVVMETVHGNDDRERIRNTTDYPWRVHCSLRLTAADNSQWIGTAWFISPRTLITAGHVVFIKGSNVPGRDGWVKQVDVMPGRDASDLPFGSVSASHLWSVTGWTEDGRETFDYGAIILDQPLGDQLGWFGYGSFTDESLLGTTVNIAGYPGDKPAGTLWYDSRGVDSLNERKVFYDIDTAGGQSGSAVYREHNGQRFAVAIHAYGGFSVNSGTRISGEVFKNLQMWDGLGR